MKKLLLVIVLAAVGYAASVRHEAPAVPEADAAADAQATPVGEANADRIGADEDQSQVQGNGVVARLLPDDDSGSRHQRFILRLPSGQTLLVAHNISLAPRIDDLRVGDTVEFSGEYAWNDQGGVVHWTHRDPAGRHAAGWLKHGGRTYQ